MTTTIVNDQDRTVVQGHRAVEPSDFDATRAADHRFDLPIDDLPPAPTCSASKPPPAS